MIRGGITTSDPGPRATCTKRVWHALQDAGFAGVRLWFETAPHGGWYFTADGVTNPRWIGFDAEHAVESIAFAIQAVAVMAYDIQRHSDRTYESPAPWSGWDDYANCWTCSECGAAAGYQIHNVGCQAVAVIRAQ